MAFHDVSPRWILDAAFRNMTRSIAGCPATRLSLLFLALCIWWPTTAQAHTEIFFPKLFSLQELPTSGFVFLNPDPTVATVYVYLIGANGVKVAEFPPFT